MFAEPVKELEGLRRVWRAFPVRSGDRVIVEKIGEMLDIETCISPEQADTVELSIRGVPLLYDVKKQELSSKNVKAPVALEEGQLRLRILVDRGSIEVFANGGRVAISVAYMPEGKNRSLDIRGRNEPITVNFLRVQDLGSIWFKK